MKEKNTWRREILVCGGAERKRSHIALFVKLIENQYSRNIVSRTFFLHNCFLCLLLTIEIILHSFRFFLLFFTHVFSLSKRILTFCLPHITFQEAAETVLLLYFLVVRLCLHMCSLHSITMYLKWQCWGTRTLTLAEYYFSEPLLFLKAESIRKDSHC